jgi:hypothetical protein
MRRGLHTTRRLEIDHNIPAKKAGPPPATSTPCRYHHHYKHTHQLRLVGEGTQNTSSPPDTTPLIPNLRTR